RTFVQNFKLANRLITNEEYLEFMSEGGYERSEFWLDEGWSKVKSDLWKAPLYWFKRDGSWFNYTLS
ncbi:MAG TPA: ergothioneine biosynthesis protein EgtB, partial [Balneola sp.]|nr:ergothioneine biosynthesis protein EgtB [Balneola sp.]